ncbi:MAG: ribulokinase [Flexilinea sp.]
MIEKRYVCGYDFGTLSCRLLVTELESGNEAFTAEMDYPDGVISEMLPGSSARLGEAWFLQNPGDYSEVMRELTSRALKKIDSRQIVAIGTDFTNCTVVALGDGGKPLCLNPAYRLNPNAWVKLWKHHAAQKYAERIEAYLKESGCKWFGEYGNNVSSEWMFPKILQVYEESRDIYDHTDVFIEGADYIVYFLTGKLIRNSATLGVNSFYNSERGFPDSVFFNSISEGWGNCIYSKLRGEIMPVGSRAGTLTPEAAAFLGLNPATVVAVGHGDSEVAAAGFGITHTGSMLMVMGTSTCYQMLYNQKITFNGVAAIVEDGMIPGLVAYESGQPAVGDSFEWYEKTLMPGEYTENAKKLGMSNLAYMDSLADKIMPGESGIVSLDWLNGNRSVLMNYSLRAFIGGLTLSSKPEHIYRSLLEATAFGARKIFDGYDKAGVKIENVLASGGLARKSPVTMQIYANVLNRDLIVPSVDNISALGACVCGAVAFEAGRGTRSLFEKVCKRMVHYESRVYHPDHKATAIYDELYAVFCELHTFAGETSDICSNLVKIQQTSNRVFE